MSKHDDFIDDYIGYRIFEDSMKGSGGGKTPRKAGGSGCGTWVVVIVIAMIVLSIFGSCSNSSSKSYSSGYRSNYSSTYVSSRSSSSSYGSGTSSHSSSSKSYPSSSSIPSSGYSSGSSKTKSNSSDPYDAKSYAHPETITPTISGIMKMLKTIGTSINKGSIFGFGWIEQGNLLNFYK